MRSAFVLLLTYILLANSSISAQQLATVYSVEQGLPQSTVTSIYRDNTAFLWVGTGDGLGVFDRSFAIGITFFHLDGNFRLCFLSSVGVNEPTQIMFQHF